jgi:hypothetical protein
MGIVLKPQYSNLKGRFVEKFGVAKNLPRIETQKWFRRQNNLAQPPYKLKTQKFGGYKSHHIPSLTLILNTTLIGPIIRKFSSRPWFIGVFNFRGILGKYPNLWPQRRDGGQEASTWRPALWGRSIGRFLSWAGAFIFLAGYGPSIYCNINSSLASD